MEYMEPTKQYSFNWEHVRAVFHIVTGTKVNDVLLCEFQRLTKVVHCSTYYFRYSNECLKM